MTLAEFWVGFRERWIEMRMKEGVVAEGEIGVEKIVREIIVEPFDEWCVHLNFLSPH